jgi:predicted nucleotidyltransferase
VGIPLLLQQVTKWAEDHDNVRALVLVGSHARGEARPDSDIDLVIICSDPAGFLDDVNWINHFGTAREHSIEDWGLVQSVRTFYGDGTEIEFGITSQEWAGLPVDPGTERVVVEGARIILDKDGAATRLLDAIKRKEQGDTP